MYPAPPTTRTDKESAFLPRRAVRGTASGLSVEANRLLKKSGIWHTRGGHEFQRLRKNSKMLAPPWKSGASAPRKPPRINAGFSHGGRLKQAKRLFPQPLSLVPKGAPNQCRLPAAGGITAREILFQQPASSTCSSALASCFIFYNVPVGSRTGRSLSQGRGKSELRRAVCRITSGRVESSPFDGKCHRKHTAPQGVRVKRCGKSAPPRQ